MPRLKGILIFILFLCCGLALPALAQNAPAGLNVNVDGDLFSAERIFQLIVVLTVLSLAPAILMMATSFTRIVVVFSFLRSALGLQSSPPNTVLVSLALFLTAFIMAPTFEAAYQNGVVPYLNDNITEEEAFSETVEPFRKFMLANVNEADLTLFVDMLPPAEQESINQAVDTGTTGDANPAAARAAAIPLRALVPAFMISELRRAFEIGFLIFLPFIVIDLVIASILMAMGMMMLPPVMISLPFKVVFFILIDGWRLLSAALVESFRVVG